MNATAQTVQGMGRTRISEVPRPICRECQTRPAEGKGRTVLGSPRWRTRCESCRRKRESSPSSPVVPDSSPGRVRVVVPESPPTGDGSTHGGRDE
jgi:hypothetical protein